MSAPGAPQIFFGADGAYITLDPGTGRYSICKKDGTVLLSLDSSGVLKQLAGLTLAGQGSVLIVAAPAIAADKSTAQTNFINYTPPGAAAIYRIIAMVNVTAWTTPASFTIVVTYTDSKGNARTETLAVVRGSTGAGAAAITAVDRWYATPFLLAIDNSATAITLSTTGTFSGSPVYQLAAVLERVA